MKQATGNKFGVIILLFMGAWAVSWFFYFKNYQSTDTVNIHLFPTKIGAWTSTEIPITKEEYEILETPNAFSRKYSLPTGEEINLLIVYSQSNRRVSHPPEICYQGSGMTVTGNKEFSAALPGQNPDFKVNRLLLEAGNYKEVAYYWFKAGANFTANYFKQQVLIAIKTFLNQPSSNALIRISTVAQNGNFSRTDKLLTEFINLLMPELVKFLP